MTNRPAPLVTLGVSFSSTTGEIYLRAYSTPDNRPYDREIRLNAADALIVARQLAAVLHYLGATWPELFPAVTDLPDEKVR